MILFLLKGLLRDRQRSLMPFLVVTIGVMLTVALYCWLTGVMGDIVDSNARFLTGHVKIMSHAYAEHQEQIPNDLALLGVDTLMPALAQEYPAWEWVQRIRFGGLIDVPDEQRETRAQGPAAGMAIDLLSGAGSEIDRLNIRTGLARGRLPNQRGEILLSDELAGRLGVSPGDAVTLIGSTMSGGMAMQNFRLAGTVRFGSAAMDRGAMLVDLLDAKDVLDMHDAAGEILGYDPSGAYNVRRADAVSRDFRARYGGSADRFAPVIFTLREQNDMAAMIDYIGVFASVVVIVFMAVLSIILWNAGLIGGLRRYGEVGIRLAIGEDKNHLYRSMLIESAAIGILGSIAGTLIGLAIAYVLETVGFDFSDMMKSASMMMPAVFRARITETAYYIGFIPGVLSTLLGTALSGIGIYRRQTASLFKELEV